LSDYVFGFGYSEDPTPFFHGKRPVSIASPYFSMEDLSSFKIHGFAQPEAKVLGLDFHDSAYHIPIEMNLKRKELDFLGFAAEAADHFSKKLFQTCRDPIQKARYQKMFSAFRGVILDRESFVASPGGRILDKKVELRKMEKRILYHPVIRILKNNTPSFDRLDFSILRLPRHFKADSSRYAVKCIETLSEDRPVGVSFVFGLIAK
jgi:hypothetical protein